MNILTNQRLKISICAVFILSFLFVSFSEVYAASYKDRYYYGVKKLVRKKKYVEAIEHFREMLADTRTSPYSDNCQYWIAECFYKMEKYEQALIEYDKVFTFSKTNKRHDAFYRLAICHEKLGENKLALELYLRFIAEYPDSKHYSQVMDKIQALQNQ